MHTVAMVSRMNRNSDEIVEMYDSARQVFSSASLSETANLPTVGLFVSPRTSRLSLIASLIQSIQPLIPGPRHLLLILMKTGTFRASEKGADNEATLHTYIQCGVSTSS